MRLVPLFFYEKTRGQLGKEFFFTTEGHKRLMRNIKK